VLSSTHEKYHPDEPSSKRLLESMAVLDWLAPECMIGSAAEATRLNQQIDFMSVN
jgi:hypothetical protein